MMFSSLWLSLLLLTGIPTDSAPPVSVFAELDGTWAGQFVGYDTSGRELYRIDVRQTYRTVDAETQEVEISDTLPDGKVITGKGRNTARRRPDGSLELLCIVEKSTGERVEHEGTLGKSPEGIPQLVWHSQAPDRSETFRETVAHEGDEWIYSIDGVGQYGESVIVMAGRYRKVAIDENRESAEGKESADEKRQLGAPTSPTPESSPPPKDES